MASTNTLRLPRIGAHASEPTDFSTYLDRRSAICPNGYANDADNHCAHFVSHVMGYGSVSRLTMKRGKVRANIAQRPSALSDRAHGRRGRDDDRLPVFITTAERRPGQ